VLEAMYAGSSVLGAACGRWLTRRLEIPAILFGTVAIAVASLIVALTSSFVLVLVVVLVSAVFDSLAAVAEDSYIQQATPDRMRGGVRCRLHFVHPWGTPWPSSWSRR
jgi:MFS-type transporter involved in bile tolerance (Atg22 family)